MLGRFRKLTQKPDAAAAPRGSAGKICYAIGDVHGRLDLLDDLLAQIEADRAQRHVPEAHVVLLGDLIDRGPDSRGVVERAQEPLGFDARLHVIKGNHEAMMAECLGGDLERLNNWFSTGGYDCVRSYGVEVGALFSKSDEDILATLRNHVPNDHLSFLEQMADSIRFGDYFLTHAGIRPGVALNQQSPQDLHWIRKPFLDSQLDHGAIVVHGHSVSTEVERKPNRIGIDTGAWKTGVLTALWIHEGQSGLLQTAGTPAIDAASEA